MRRLPFGLLLSAALLCAPATRAQVVERSGATYHRAVCAAAPAGLAHCHAHVVTDRGGHALANADAPVGGYGPSDLREAYNIAADGDSSTVVAIVDAFGYDNAETDLGTYRSFFGLPECTTANGCFEKLNQKGQQGDYPDQNIGWAEESALDLDMASAMCPNCKIWLVEAKTNSLKNLAAAVETAAQLGAHVISNSYGGTGSPGKKLQKAFRHPGVAITASSGDSGFGTQFPAASPYVTAVGGTHLVRDGSDRGWAETAWGGSGSGCTTYKKPKWQTDSGCPKRTIVDVAADADPATGVAVFGPNGAGHGTWLVFGGTSVSAPLIAGVYGANGGKVKYGSNPYAHPEALFDIVSGTNGTCTPSYLCNAGTGYDGPTGMGTPDGTAAFGEN